MLINPGTQVAPVCVSIHIGLPHLSSYHCSTGGNILSIKVIFPIYKILQFRLCKAKYNYIALWANVFIFSDTQAAPSTQSNAVSTQTVRDVVSQAIQCDMDGDSDVGSLDIYSSASGSATLDGTVSAPVHFGVHQSNGDEEGKFLYQSRWRWLFSSSAPTLLTPSCGTYTQRSRSQPVATPSSTACQPRNKRRFHGLRKFMQRFNPFHQRKSI